MIANAPPMMQSGNPMPMPRQPLGGEMQHSALAEALLGKPGPDMRGTDYSGAFPNAYALKELYDKNNPSQPGAAPGTPGQPGGPGITDAINGYLSSTGNSPMSTGGPAMSGPPPGMGIGGAAMNNLGFGAGSAPYSTPTAPQTPVFGGAS